MKTLRLILDGTAISTNNYEAIALLLEDREAHPDSLVHLLAIQASVALLHRDQDTSYVLADDSDMFGLVVACIQAALPMYKAVGVEYI